jgi:hypothetical protein
VEGDLSGVTTQVGNFSDWRSMNQSFEDLAAYFAFFDYGSYTLTGSGEPERLRGVGVSQNFLDLLGVSPEIGRGFDDAECIWNGRGAVLLSHGFWERRFGSDPGIVGSPITLNNKPRPHRFGQVSARPRLRPGRFFFDKLMYNTCLNREVPRAGWSPVQLGWTSAIFPAEGVP